MDIDYNGQRIQDTFNGGLASAFKEAIKCKALFKKVAQDENGGPTSDLKKCGAGPVKPLKAGKKAPESEVHLLDISLVCRLIRAHTLLLPRLALFQTFLSAALLNPARATLVLTPWPIKVFQIRDGCLHLWDPWKGCLRVSQRPR